MRWQKLGRIFNPDDHPLPEGCAQFAQSPQAIVFDEFVRIYFSTRSIDGAGRKYRSHVAFVDMDKEFRGVLGKPRGGVIDLGRLGCFDEHGIFPFSVLRDGDRLLAYTTGWSRRVSVSVETGIGLAVSEDGGQTFQRLGDGPVLSASLHEPYLVGDAFVRIIGGLFHMWYIFGTRWKSYSTHSAPDRIYKIGHAVSNDGIHWEKEEARQIIADRLGADESQALPSVTQIGDRYHMFFCFRQSWDFRVNRERGYRIGHAWSNDLRSWVRDDETPSLRGTPGEWDSDMQCYPHVFEIDDRIVLLYNGNEFGRHGFGAAVLQTE